VVLAFQLKADDLQGRGHAYLLDLPALGKGRFEVLVGQARQWVSFSWGPVASQKRPFLRALKPRILEGDGAALIVIGHIRNGAGDAGSSSDRQLFNRELVGDVSENGK